VRQLSASQARRAALTDPWQRDDAMSSLSLTGRYNEPDLGLKEHTMWQVTAIASNQGDRR
jgi:hypothetical protein